MYVKLLTRPFIRKHSSQSISKKRLVKEIQSCYKNIAFSTFPYIRNSYSSKQCIRHTDSGNCIALAMFIKLNLKKKYNINSYLIPATVPSYIMRDGYLEICHVALAIPINLNSYYIVDPAFYFLEPIKVNISTFKANSIKSVQIDGFTQLDTVTPNVKKTTTKIVLNDYQSIPKNTYYCECYSNNNTNDTWKYYLREVINPDEAITNFFIKIRNRPFFVSTNMENGVCVKEMSIRQLPDNGISIQFKNKTIYNGPMDLLQNNIKNNIANFLRNRHFDASIIFN
tara:strand:- start:1586 stop:2434 length:849 start_codon:yes stop_codon:yes gene_type:complete